MDPRTYPAWPCRYGSFLKPLCNCNEWKKSGGYCKHIPPALLGPATIGGQPNSHLELYNVASPPVSTSSSSHSSFPPDYSRTLPGAMPSAAPPQFHNAVHNTLAAPRAARAANLGQPSLPLPLPSPPSQQYPGYPFCTCPEFKSTGACKHLSTLQSEEFDLVFPRSSVSFGNLSSSAHVPSLSSSSSVDESTSGEKQKTAATFKCYFPGCTNTYVSNRNVERHVAKMHGKVEDKKKTLGGPKGRLERNRINSRNYQAKKKEKMIRLEKQVKEMQARISEQQQTLTVVQSEKGALWEQVNHLRSYISTLVGGSGGSDTLMSAVSPMLPRGGPMSSFHGSGPLRNMVPRISNGSVGSGNVPGGKLSESQSPLQTHG